MRKIEFTAGAASSKFQEDEMKNSKGFTLIEGNHCLRDLIDCSFGKCHVHQ